jgi:quinol monooxygenase YgiN
MIIELIGILAPHEKRQELGDALVSLLGPIQVQPGCISCRLFHSLPKQDGLQIEARWADRETLIGHLQSDIYKKLLLLMELSATPPALEFFTVTEVRGLDLVEVARAPAD